MKKKNIPIKNVGNKSFDKDVNKLCVTIHEILFIMVLVSV